MARFLIHGGRRLSGGHRPSGNKNAALPMLAACVLTEEPVRLRNVPMIADVRTMLAILDELGADVSVRGHTVTVCARGVRKTRLHSALCRQARSSILFAGPLAARFGRATLPPPGGDVIGRRRLDTHFDALRQLGIRVDGNGTYRFRRRSLRGADVLLDEASVTATENVVMAAVLASGTTVLFHAACEPHVQDLCVMLNRMGARIAGIGTNRLLIEGVPSLGGVTHTLKSDAIEAASYAAAAALTGGEVVLEDVDPIDWRVVSRPCARLGVETEHRGSRVRVPAGQVLRVRNDYGSAIPKIEDGPWPSVPSDIMSVALVMATRAKGTTLFFEKMYESRLYFVDRLIDMGARIVQCDPHRVMVAGPCSLHGTHLASPDIRAGMALLIAALCARGPSMIDNAEVIDRGYERVDDTLRRLGADVVRMA